MNTASLELCRELFELSGWNATRDVVYRMEEGKPIATNAFDDRAVGAIPAYDLGYLLRKLPRKAWQLDFYLIVSDSSWVAGYASKHPTGLPRSAFADTPEDAAAKLAVELFKQDILKRE